MHLHVDLIVDPLLCFSKQPTSHADTISFAAGLEDERSAKDLPADCRQLFGKKVGRVSSVLSPPAINALDVLIGFRRKDEFHDRDNSRRSTSSPSTVRPARTDAMA